MTQNLALHGQNDSGLIEIESYKLHPDAVSALEQMRLAAREDGVTISIASAHRDFARQLSIWNRKWRGELPILSRDSVVLAPQSLSDEEKLHAILTWSALPGTSRHHWGTDLDVYDANEVEGRNHRLELIPQEYTGDGPCASLSNWIVSNAHRFGFYLPYAEDNQGVAVEPWHLSYYPIAADLLTQLTPDAVGTVISDADIEGKATILENLDDILEQYVYNISPAPQKETS